MKRLIAGVALAFAAGAAFAQMAGGVMESQANSIAAIRSGTIDGTVIGGTTPAAGTFTTVNKVTITQPATAATLTIANNKTATVNNTLTFSGTDSTVMTFPSTSATIARTDAANTFTGNQTVAGSAILSTTSGPINLNNSGGFGSQLNPQGFGCMHGAYAANDYCEMWLLGGSGNNNNEIGHYIRSTLSGNGTGVGTAALTIGKATWTGVVISPQTAQLTLASNGGLSTAAYYATTAPNTRTSASYSVLDTDNWIISNQAATLTLTLQSAASYTGRSITVKTIQAQTVVSASSNVVPCVGGSAGTAILAATAGKWATLVSDGSNWVIMACN